jgi:hypothetical protein
MTEHFPLWAIDMYWSKGCPNLDIIEFSEEEKKLSWDEWVDYLDCLRAQIIAEHKGWT